MLYGASSTLKITSKTVVQPTQIRHALLLLLQLLLLQLLLLLLRLPVPLLLPLSSLLELDSSSLGLLSAVRFEGRGRDGGCEAGDGSGAAAEGRPAQ